jgi:hypothetical protein
MKQLDATTLDSWSDADLRDALIAVNRVPNRKLTNWEESFINTVCWNNRSAIMTDNQRHSAANIITKYRENGRDEVRS